MSRSNRHGGQSRWLVAAGVEVGRCDTRIGGWRSRFPWKGVLVEINFGRERDSGHTGHVDVVSARCSEAAPQIDAYPRAWLDARL
eukprot:6214072-Pleurochrysis_carterae.AAC.1